jgi:DNA (cytosine-5)-methyltransferase 1
MKKTENPTVIDLFCGCGGFSLGLEYSKFTTLAAIDFNKESIETYRKNFPSVTHVLEKDLTLFPPQELGDLIGTKEVDVIVGGPPCQGFSTVRKRDGSNHGLNPIDDERRFLYKEFLKYVNYFTPKVFVMENVLGIKTTDCGKYYRSVQDEARSLGYRVNAIAVTASDYGVPQKRRRQLIIGTRRDLPVYFREKYLNKFIITPQVTLGEAIGDLPKLKAGEGAEITDYKITLREKHISKYGTRYLFGVLKADQAEHLSSHVARPHNEQDLRDFSKIREGENSKYALKRGVELEFTYDRSCFKDRYTRQNRNSLCSTIVAHLSKDGLMFIHPTQNRSLTPREAARIQTFPDTFEFPVPRTHQYRLIGNAVPPLVGEVVGKAIINYLNDVVDTLEKGIDKNLKELLPKNPVQAAERIMDLKKAADDDNIKFFPWDKFKMSWYAVLYTYPILHPDCLRVNENGYGKSYTPLPFVDKDVADRYNDLVVPYYAQNGCPTVLVPVIKEAWRRYNNNEIKEDDFYSSQALLAAISYESR